ncbi:MAG: CvpA family protein [Clostridia bacterium]|nr:CvpA family protein [Clostridia bacterium]
MNNISLMIDVILVLILVSCVFDGRRKGFVKMVLSIAATIVSILIAYEYSVPVAEWANEAFVHEATVNTIAEMITSHLNGGTQAVINAIPEYIIDAAETGGVSVSSVISDIGSSVDAVQAAEQIYSGIYNVIIETLLSAAAFFVVYAVCNFILSFGVSAINRFFRLPVLKGLNKLLGGVLGGVKGVIVITVVSLTLVVAGDLFPDAVGVVVKESNIPQIVADIIIK